MDAATLDQLMADFQDRALPEMTPRSASLPLVPGKADVVTGMRRAGKTWFMFQQVGALEAQGVHRSHVLYLNLEDERLHPIETRQLELIREAWFRRFPEVRAAEHWLFLDEIQEAPGWERFVRRLVDDTSARVVLSGSNARLLGREIATSLRGRSLSTELLPFSFCEVLAHRTIPVPTHWPAPAGLASQLQHALDRYLVTGGFPEVQDLDEERRHKVLSSYVDVMMLRDVLERHQATNPAALRYLVRRLVTGPARKISVNRLYNDLRSQGLSAGKDTLHDYLQHLQDAFLCFLVPVHSVSVQARRVTPRKAYLVDHGLSRPHSARPDTGHRLENAVAVELRRRGYSLSWVSTPRGEVDFLASHPEHPTRLVQVCADLSSGETRARELRGLESAAVHHPDALLEVVSLRESEELVLADRRVHIVPAWEWLLRT